MKTNVAHFQSALPGKISPARPMPQGIDLPLMHIPAPNRVAVRNADGDQCSGVKRPSDAMHIYNRKVVMKTQDQQI